MCCAIRPSGLVSRPVEPTGVDLVWRAHALIDRLARPTGVSEEQDEQRKDESLLYFLVFFIVTLRISIEITVNIH